MAWVLNKSGRAYNIGGVLVSPLVPVFLDDSFLSIARVKEIIASGDLEVSSEKPEVEEIREDVKTKSNKPVE
jgi:hypothetical protein